MDFNFNDLIHKKIYNRQEFAIVYVPVFLLTFFIYSNQYYFLNDPVLYLVILGIILLCLFVTAVAFVRRGRDLKLSSNITVLLYIVMPFSFWFFCFMPSRTNSVEESSTEKDNDTPPLNLEEELKYQKVSDELEANEINKALWLRAEQEADGDKEKIRPIYIKLRIKSLEYEDDKNNNLDYLHKKLEDLEKKKEEAYGEYTKATENVEKYEEDHEDLQDDDQELIRLKNIEEEKHDIWDKLWDEHNDVDKRLDEVDPERIEARERKIRKRKRKRRNIIIVLGIIVFGIWYPNPVRDYFISVWLRADNYTGESSFFSKDGYGVKIYDSGNKYSGDWKSNKREGWGIIEYKKGDKYMGNWKDDKIHGYGTYTWANGDKYKGHFKEWKMHGAGTFISSNGEIRTSTWENGSDINK